MRYTIPLSSNCDRKKIIPMSKLSCVVILFLLTGCIGFYDKAVGSTETAVNIKNNRVCAVSLMKPGEKMIAVEIYSHDGEKKIETFPAKPLYVPLGECLPLFGTTFKTGDAYYFYWHILPVKGDLQLISAKFTVTIDPDGRLLSLNRGAPD